MPEAAAPRNPSWGRRWSWVLMGLVLAVALTVGARGESGQLSAAQRAHAIADEVRCPTCRGLSAADSDAPAAQAIRDDILRRVQAGQSGGEIRAYLVSRYKEEILLKPERDGVAGLVWILPVGAVALAVGGMALAFRRWRARPDVAVSAADQAMVAEALHR